MINFLQKRLIHTQYLTEEYGENSLGGKKMMKQNENQCVIMLQIALEMKKK